MNSILTFTRKLITFICSLFFLFIAMLIPFSISLSSTILDKEYVKTIIKESNIYQHTELIFLELLIKDYESNENLKGVVIRLANEDDELSKVLKGAFNTTLLQSNLESIIDGTYTFLSGSSDTITFQIKLFNNQSEFQNAITLLITERVKNLPECGTVVIIDNYFNMECRPQNFDQKDISLFVSETLSKDEIYRYFVSSNEQHKVVAFDPENVKNIQDIYRTLKYSYFILTVVLLTLIILLYLCSTYRKGVFKLLYIILFTAITLNIGLSLFLHQNKRFITDLILNFIPSNTVKAYIDGTTFLQSDLNIILGRLITDFFTMSTKVSFVILISLSIFAILIYIVLRFSSSNKAHSDVA